ncbi:MAG: amidohydrolase family protein [Gammaproteobacteria bacterium]
MNRFTDKFDKDGTRLPIKIDSTSNGEYEPIPVSQANAQGNKLALEQASDLARRKGQSRRKFLISSCGAASTLLAFNQVNAAHRKTGGYFELRDESALDEASAFAEVGGGEFIFDVQGHYVNPEGDWLSRMPPAARPYAGMEKAACELANEAGDRSYLNCLSASEFIKDIFLDSDTDIMVLSFVPSTRETEPVTIEDADRTRQIVSELEGSKRLMIHGRVNPNQEGDLEAMDELAENWNISAFKTYTQYGPGGVGFFLSDDVGRQMIERARRLGVRNICVHKGLPFGPRSYEHSQCSDIGVVAKDYPDINFLIYHSGFVAGNDETPFVDGSGRDGIDTLIQSLVDNEVAPNANVYAELGSTWRFLMRDPDNAAHALGKLFTHVGENNVLWGTDSIWYGSPQDQIQAFRTFQISQEFQDRFGYPAITPELRQKVFGLNAVGPYGIEQEEVRRFLAADQVSNDKIAYQQDPQPTFLTYGPRTRREFLNFLKWGG